MEDWTYKSQIFFYTTEKTKTNTFCILHKQITAQKAWKLYKYEKHNKENNNSVTVDTALNITFLTVD